MGAPIGANADMERKRCGFLSATMSAVPAQRMSKHAGPLPIYREIRREAALA